MKGGEKMNDDRKRYGISAMSAGVLGIIFGVAGSIIAMSLGDEKKKKKVGEKFGSVMQIALDKIDAIGNKANKMELRAQDAMKDVAKKAKQVKDSEKSGN